MATAGSSTSPPNEWLAWTLKTFLPLAIVLVAIVTAYVRTDERVSMNTRNITSLEIAVNKRVAEVKLDLTARLDRMDVTRAEEMKILGQKLDWLIMRSAADAAMNKGDER